MKIFSNNVQFILEFKQLPSDMFDMAKHVTEDHVEACKKLKPGQQLIRPEFGTYGIGDRPLFDYQINAAWTIDNNELNCKILSVVVFYDRREGNHAMWIAAQINHIISIKK